MVEEERGRLGVRGISPCGHGKIGYMMINRPRWVVPVLQNGELEVLLEATINLCKSGEIVNFISSTTHSKNASAF